MVLRAVRRLSERVLPAGRRWQRRVAVVGPARRRDRRERRRGQVLLERDVEGLVVRPCRVPGLVHGSGRGSTVAVGQRGQPDLAGAVQHAVVHLAHPVQRELEAHGAQAVHAQLATHRGVRVERVDVLLAQQHAAAAGFADQVVHEVRGSPLGRLQLRVHGHRGVPAELQRALDRVQEPPAVQRLQEDVAEAGGEPWGLLTEPHPAPRGQPELEGNLRESPEQLHVRMKPLSGKRREPLRDIFVSPLRASSVSPATAILACRIRRTAVRELRGECGLWRAAPGPGPTVCA